MFIILVQTALTVVLSSAKPISADQTNETGLSKSSGIDTSYTSYSTNRLAYEYRKNATQPN